mgnify:CR=1 FL=1
MEIIYLFVLIVFFSPCTVYRQRMIHTSAAFFQRDTFGKLSGEFSGNSRLRDSAVPRDMRTREAFSG